MAGSPQSRHIRKLITTPVLPSCNYYHFSISTHPRFYITNIHYRFANDIMQKLGWNLDILEACVYTCGFEVLSSITKEINCRAAYSFWQEQHFSFILGKGIPPPCLVQIMTLNTEFIFIESSIYLRNYHEQPFKRRPNVNAGFDGVYSIALAFSKILYNALHNASLRYIEV